jgi:hypothetical protein
MSDFPLPWFSRLREVRNTPNLIFEQAAEAEILPGIHVPRGDMMENALSLPAAGKPKP